MHCVTMTAVAAVVELHGVWLAAAAASLFGVEHGNVAGELTVSAGEAVATDLLEAVGELFGPAQLCGESAAAAAAAAAASATAAAAGLSGSLGSAQAPSPP